MVPILKPVVPVSEVMLISKILLPVDAKLVMSHLHALMMMLTGLALKKSLTMGVKTLMNVPSDKIMVNQSHQFAKMWKLMKSKPVSVSALIVREATPVNAQPDTKKLDQLRRVILVVTTSKNVFKNRIH